MPLAWTNAIATRHKRQWVSSFVVELAELGFNAPFVHAACAMQPDDMAAITFTPSDGFAQTPGPGAGSRLDTSGQQTEPKGRSR